MGDACTPLLKSTFLWPPRNRPGTTSARRRATWDLHLSPPPGGCTSCNFYKKRRFLELRRLGELGAMMCTQLQALAKSHRALFPSGPPWCHRDFSRLVPLLPAPFSQDQHPHRTGTASTFSCLRQPDSMG